MSGRFIAPGGAWAATLSLWLPLVLADAVAPFGVRHIAAAPVLQKLFALSAAVGLLLSAAVAGLSCLGGLALRGRERPPERALDAITVSSAASALIVSAHAPVHALVARAGAPAEIALAVLVVGGVASAVLGLAAIGGLAGTRHLPRVRWLLLAAAIVAWTAAVAMMLELSPVERRTLLVLCGITSLALISMGVSAADGRVAGAVPTRFAILVVGLAVPALTVVMPERATRPLGPTALAPAGARNVVVVVIDTLRADHTSVTGYARETTPALASSTSRDATRFTRATAAGSSTIPSVKALLTGRSPSSWGVERGNDPPPAGEWTLAEAFRAAGYATAAFSANPLIEGEGFRTGFGEFWSAGGYRFYLRSLLLNHLLSGDRTWDVMRRVEALRLHKVSGATVGRLARDWLESHHGTAFFLYLHLIDPHWPYYENGYGFVTPDLAAVRERYSHVDLMRLGHGAPRNARLRGPSLDEMIARYDEDVRLADDALGQILADLVELGVRDSTLTVVVGDHGEEFLEHNGFGHGHDVFEEQIHVPLAFLWPAGAEFRGLPREVDAPVSLLDVAPTLADYAAVGGPRSAGDGRSLRTLLSEPSTIGGRAVVSEAFLPSRLYGAYREGNLKARFRYSDEIGPADTPHVLVFDLAKDPGEQRPLPSDEPRARELVGRARGVLQERWSR